MAVRGVLRWVLPWYASGTEGYNPFNPDATPPERMIEVPAVPNMVSPQSTPRTIVPSKSVHMLESEE